MHATTLPETDPGMTLKRLTYLIRSDHYRYHGGWRPRALLKDLFFNRGFHITFFYRIMHYLFVNRRRFLLLALNLYYYDLQTRYGCELPYRTRIGPGFYFGHVMGTIINGGSIIGSNVNMSHAVTLGGIAAGKRRGSPVIGDRVYLGPGAKVIGGVWLSRGTAVGANAVVTRDTPENAVVVGVPAEVISTRGAGDYVLRTVPDEWPHLPLNGRPQPPAPAPEAETPEPVLV